MVGQTAGSASAAPVCRAHHPVTGVDVLLRFRSEVRKRLEPSFDLTAHGSNSRSRVLADGSHVIHELEPGAKEARPACDVVRVKGGDASPDKLHVLLRHRLLG